MLSHSASGDGVRCALSRPSARGSGLKEWRPWRLISRVRVRGALLATSAGDGGATSEGPDSGASSIASSARYAGGTAEASATRRDSGGELGSHPLLSRRLLPVSHARRMAVTSSLTTTASQCMNSSLVTSTRFSSTCSGGWGKHAHEDRIEKMMIAFYATGQAEGLAPGR